jgi:hypothetical protein
MDEPTRFTCLVHLTVADVAHGMGGNGEPYTRYRLECEGTLSAFDYGDVASRLPHSKTWVSVQIQFGATDESVEKLFEMLDTLNDNRLPDGYVGTIQLRDRALGQMLDSDDMDFRANLCVTLPVGLFDTLRACEGKVVCVDAFGDVIDNPNDAQKLDKIVAFVRSVRFTASADAPPDTKKSWFLR